ncbi:MAG: NAD-dependent epimerase/dehydratase family protein [Candidatus Helarchaeota archaeon]
MKVLITGSNGFIGSHLAALLKVRGHEVKCLVRKTSNLDLLKKLTDNLNGIQLCYGDVTNISSLIEATRDVEVVFHLAAALNTISQMHFDRINVEGTRNLYEALLKTNPNVKRVIYVSSFAAAGAAKSRDHPATEKDKPHPVTRYGLSKLKAEIVSKKYMKKIPIVIVRPPFVFGEGDVPSLDLFKLAKTGLKLYQNTPDKYLSIIHADELCDALILCAEKQEAIGETFYFAQSEVITYQDLHELIATLVFKKRYGSLLPLKMPLWLYWILAWLFESLRRITGNVLIQNIVIANGRVFESLEPYQIVSTAKARRILGWKPKRTLIEMIKKTGKWYIDQGWL